MQILATHYPVCVSVLMESLHQSGRLPIPEALQDSLTDSDFTPSFILFPIGGPDHLPQSTLNPVLTLADLGSNEREALGQRQWTQEACGGCRAHVPLRHHSLRHHENAGMATPKNHWLCLRPLGHRLSAPLFTSLPYLPSISARGGRKKPGEVRWLP